MSAALVIECNIFTIFMFLPAMHTSVVQLFYMAHIFISFAFSYVFKHKILIASGNSVHRNDWLSIEIWAKKLWGRERFKMLVAEGATSAGVHLGGQQIICEASKLIRFVDTWRQKTKKKSVKDLCRPFLGGWSTILPSNDSIFFRIDSENDAIHFLKFQYDLDACRGLIIPQD